MNMILTLQGRPRVHHQAGGQDGRRATGTRRLDALQAAFVHRGGGDSGRRRARQEEEVRVPRASCAFLITFPDVSMTKRLLYTETAEVLQGRRARREEVQVPGA